MWDDIKNAAGEILFPFICVVLFFGGMAALALMVTAFHILLRALQ